MLNIKYCPKTIPLTISLFLLIINTVSCQDLKKQNEDYLIIERKTSQISTDIKEVKSKTEKEDFRFTKELASEISPILLENTQKVIISEETNTYKSKDTVNYIVYDFILKKETDSKNVEQKSNFGLKRISLYEMPVSCLTFFNKDKITCVCENKFHSELLNQEEFINSIITDTPRRVNLTIKKQP